MIKKLIDFIAGRKGLQTIFETLYKASIYGMNYGGGGNFASSGERFAVNYIKEKLSKNQHQWQVFDVGANKGNYSIDVARIFSGHDFVIHAFEPSKATFEILKKNLDNDKRFVINNCGCGEITEKVKLFSRGPLSGLSSVYKRRLDHFNIDMSASEEILITTLDQYCQSNDIQKIDFLKMDIEGHEFKCLLGAAGLLEDNNIRFIQFEFGGCNIDSRIFFQDYWYLLKEKYNIYRIVKDGLVPIVQYNERLEIFKNINYLAELKSI